MWTRTIWSIVWIEIWFTFTQTVWSMGWFLFNTFLSKKVLYYSSLTKRFNINPTNPKTTTFSLLTSHLHLFVLISSPLEVRNGKLGLGDSSSMRKRMEMSLSRQFLSPLLGIEPISTRLRLTSFNPPKNWLLYVSKWYSVLFCEIGETRDQRGLGWGSFELLCWGRQEIAGNPRSMPNLDPLEAMACYVNCIITWLANKC